MRVNWIEYPDKEMAEIIVKELKRLNIENNPLVSIYNSKRNKLITPSIGTINKRFGGWVEFIHEYTDFRYKNKISWKEYSDEDVALIIKTEMELIGGTITADKYKKLFNSERAPSASTIQLRFGSWNNFIEKYTDLPKTESTVGIYWSQYSTEDLAAVIIAELKRIGIENNPTSYLYSKKRNTKSSPCLYTVAKRFGSWKEFIGRYYTNVKYNYKVEWSNYPTSELLSLISTELDRIGKPVNSSKYRKSYDRHRAPSCSMIISKFGSWGIMLKEIEKRNKLKERI